MAAVQRKHAVIMFGDTLVCLQRQCVQYNIQSDGALQIVLLVRST